MNITNSTHLRSSKGRLKTSSTSFTPKLQSGMTLIEVLIAMFVLAIGVLALLAVQLRTVSSVRESENQTTVAQITQNLIEGMLINPTLSEKKEVDKITGEETSRYKKSYDAYINKDTKRGICGLNSKEPAENRYPTHCHDGCGCQSRLQASCWQSQWHGSLR